jgi:NAD dependent epimerase/dehydratase family enzyme
MSWIHIDDIVGAIRHALAKDEVMAAVNGVSPEPVTNADFGRALGRALSRPAFLPAPAFALKIGFGEMSTILLEGQKVLPKKLLDTGYRFRFPNLPGALADILARKR